MCCALSFCNMPTTKLSTGMHKCTDCEGILHGVLCSLEGSGENEWMLCLNCHYNNSKLPAVSQEDQGQQSEVTGTTSTDEENTSDNDILSASLVPSLSSIHADLEHLKNKPWHSQLNFKGYLCLPIDSLPTSNCGNSSPYEKVHDLFVLTHKDHKGLIVRFDPSVYPVVPGGIAAKANSQSLAKLKSALEIICSNEDNFTLVSNAFQHGKCIMKCSRFRYQQETKKKIAPGQLRKQSLNCNKKNQRQGKKKREALKHKRATSTALPVKESGEILCKCNFSLSADEYSFYFCCGLGNRTHQGHLPLSKKQRVSYFKNLPQQVQTLCKMCARSGIGPGAVARLVENLHDIHITSRQVSRNTYSAKLALDIAGADTVKAGSEGMSDIDIITEHFHKTGQIYTALFHRQLKQVGNNTEDVLWNETGIGNANPEVAVFENTGQEGSNADIMEYAATTRTAIGATEDQDVLVALVWMSSEQQQLFEAFPDSLAVDGTHKTQKENWELITMAVLDMAGNPEVVIKCWAPNNRRWLFKWLFETAVPAMVGRPACAGVKLVITDGDSQECTQLDMALETTFVSAKRRRCGWHIVDRGWTRKLPVNLGFAKQHKRFRQVTGMIMIVKAWLYSLMKEIETEKEYLM